MGHLQPSLLSAPQNSGWRRGCRDAETPLWDQSRAKGTGDGMCCWEVLFCIPPGGDRDN